uniref:CDP-alcohol phosphatidyltransferase family protein n=2 Tax=unclassified Prevotella TaxID=2638335 RepID=A0AB33IUR7_9BACT
MKSSFRELLQASFKSQDTEEWLDVHFTRPIGLVFALFWNKLNVHPNAITILSIFLGIGAGYMFYFTDLMHNIMGVLLLMFANFCDSTDGQMARLTGKKTLVGRVLDGFSGDVWFACIYIAISLRLMNENMPYTDVKWGIWIWLLNIVAGLVCHSPQSSLSDYYRQIHLFFLKGKSGSELDNYASQRVVYEQMKKEGNLLGRIFYYNYANYCKSQEHRTPKFQTFFKRWQEQPSEDVRQEFLVGSRPLMAYTNILTFNTRAIVIYITCLLNCPWVYPLFELSVMTCLYIYMHSRHESLCERLTGKLAQ